MALRFVVAGIVISIVAAGTGANAQAPVPTARQISLAHQIVYAPGLKESVEGTLRAMMGQVAAGMSQSASAQDAARTKAIADAISNVTVRFTPKMMDISVETYANTFTEDELAGILAFRLSPAGQALQRKSPEFAKKVGEAMAPLMPEIRQEFAAGLAAAMTTEIGEKVKSKP